MYSAEDLADLAGVPVRTVRYYLRRGVLSKPLPQGGRYGGDQYKRFTGEHLQQLREVQAILDRNMTLDDIRDHLHPVEDDDE